MNKIIRNALTTLTLAFLATAGTSLTGYANGEENEAVEKTIHLTLPQFVQEFLEESTYNEPAQRLKSNSQLVVQINNSLTFNKGSLEIKITQSISGEDLVQNLNLPEELIHQLSIEDVYHPGLYKLDNILDNAIKNKAFSGQTLQNDTKEERINCYETALCIGIPEQKESEAYNNGYYTFQGKTYDKTFQYYRGKLNNSHDFLGDFIVHENAVYTLKDNQLVKTEERNTLLESINPKFGDLIFFGPFHVGETDNEMRLWNNGDGNIVNRPISDYSLLIPLKKHKLDLNTEIQKGVTLSSFAGEAISIADLTAQEILHATAYLGLGDDLVFEKVGISVSMPFIINQFEYLESLYIDPIHDYRPVPIKVLRPNNAYWERFKGKPLLMAIK